jgi:hypothetical protein
MSGFATERRFPRGTTVMVRGNPGGSVMAGGPCGITLRQTVEKGLEAGAFSREVPTEGGRRQLHRMPLSKAMINCGSQHI